METEEAKAAYSKRKELVEPAFGIIKEQLGVRRFLLRGLANVTAEFVMVATAFNLLTLWRLVWRPDAYKLLSRLAHAARRLRGRTFPMPFHLRRAGLRVLVFNRCSQA
jgi:hypothetical protein